MKALTIKQPWAWAIMAGLKTAENRSWFTPHRGRLLIHAGARIDARSVVGDVFAAAGAVLPTELATGVILGTVDLVSICSPRELAGDPWAFGPWCWRLENPQPFAEPIPWRGQLGLFDVPDSVLPACAFDQSKTAREALPTSRQLRLHS
jgi:hypothetical protein